ncbi:MAG: hypothetical protein ACR2P8_03320 [Myxococcota bacterium]
MARIHPTAVVDPGAKLADDVELGPYTVVGDGVELGPGVVVGSHVIVVGRTKVGARTRIFPFSVIGEEPQVQGVEGETFLQIGCDNIIREYASIHAGSPIGVGSTRIGDGNFILNNVHVAHDCQIGSNCVIASFSAMAGQSSRTTPCSGRWSESTSSCASGSRPSPARAASSPRTWRPTPR